MTGAYADDISAVQDNITVRNNNFIIMRYGDNECGNFQSFFHFDERHSVQLATDRQFEFNDFHFSRRKGMNLFRCRKLQDMNNLMRTDNSGLMSIFIPSRSRKNSNCSKYSGSRTRAIRCFAPRTRATMQQRILFSSCGITETIISHFSTPASRRTSALQPFPQIP